MPVKPRVASPKDPTYYTAAVLSIGLLGWSTFLVGFLFFALFVAPLLH